MHNKINDIDVDSGDVENNIFSGISRACDIL